MLRRLIQAGLALILILGTGQSETRQEVAATRLSHLRLAGTASANQGEWRARQCRYRHLEDGWGWSYHEVSLTIRCATAHWTVDGGFTKALAVGQCESGLNYLAYNAGGFAGVYQHAIAYWPARFANLAPPWWALRPSVFNGRSNVVIAIRYAALYSWSAWSCA